MSIFVLNLLLKEYFRFGESSADFMELTEKEKNRVREEAKKSSRSEE
ncbi:MAG: hypothetical protein J1G30_04315 [Spirochaetales bacterium]|nr:hypothetical protein [Spirochaetales bacterium]